MTEGITIAIIALGATIPPTILGVITLAVQRQTRKSQNDHGATLAHIEILTNSTLANALKRITDLEKQMTLAHERFEQKIKDLNKEIRVREARLVAGIPADWKPKTTTSDRSVP